MKRWVAERGVNDPNIWRDEDVAMATERHVLPDQDTARTMLVGMLTREGYGWYAMNHDADRKAIFLKLAELVALERMDRVELPWNKVFYQIRPM